MAIEGEEGGGLAEEAVDGGSGEDGGEGGEEELEGGEGGGEGRQGEDGPCGGENGREVGARVRVLGRDEEGVEVDEEDDALGSGEVEDAEIHERE